MPLSQASRLPGPPEICAPCHPTLGLANNWTMPGKLCTQLFLLLCYSILHPSAHSLIHPPPHPCFLPLFIFSHPALGPVPQSRSLSFQVIDNLWPCPCPGEPCFPACRGMSPKFPRSRSNRSSSVLSRAGSVGGISWGGSVLGCSLSKGGLLEGPWSSSRVGVSLGGGSKLGF